MGVLRLDEGKGHALAPHGRNAEIEARGFEDVLEQAISEALDGPEVIYLSVDIDVLEPAFAPGTGTPEPS